MSSSKNAAATGIADNHSFTDTHGVLVSTMNDIPGHRVVKVSGAVYGLSVRSRNVGANIVSGLKSLAGGELPYMTRLLYTSRNEAVERMLGEAMGRGANGIIAMRFDISEVLGFTQVCAYGTACVIEKVE